jgi:DNA-binding transcriptional MerR regulator
MIHSRLRIGELARLCDTSSTVIKDLETTGLIPDPRRGLPGQREYNDVDLIRLQTILIFRELGYSLSEIRNVFGRFCFIDFPCPCLLEKIGRNIRTLGTMIEKLNSIEHELQKLQNLNAACDTDSPANIACPDHNTEITKEPHRKSSPRKLMTTGDVGRLNLKEKDILLLKLTQEGLSNIQIAESLNLKYATIRNRFAHIYEKLKVSDKIGALVKARELGLVE